MNPQEVSVTAPVGQAIERAKEILFRPFKLEKWIAIGFCAWLAALGQGGGSGFHSPSSFGSGNSGGDAQPPFDSAQVRQFLHEYLPAIIGGVLILLVFVLAIAVVFLWLQSRGTFMFLDCVVHNRGAVVDPWKKYAREAHSLWFFRICLMMAGFCVVLPMLLACGWEVYGMYLNHWHPVPGQIETLVGIGLLWMVIGLALNVVSCFTRDFVAPIMYLRGGTCLESWGVFRGILFANPWRFLLYLIFKILLAIAIGFLVIAFILCTLCIGGLLLIIPFVGTVTLLPVHVFKRSYSLYYLAQYGGDLDLFRAAIAEPPPWPVSTFPPMA
jgi:hypothetical protein